MFNSIRKLSTVILGLSTVAPPSLFAAADAVRVTVVLPEIVSESYHGFCIPDAPGTSYTATTDADNLSYESLPPSNTFDGQFLKDVSNLIVIDSDPSSNQCGASPGAGYIQANNRYVR